MPNMRLQRDAAKRRAPEACRSAKKRMNSYLPIVLIWLTIMLACDATTPDNWMTVTTRNPKVVISFPDSWTKVHPMHKFGEIEIRSPVGEVGVSCSFSFNAGNQEMRNLDEYVETLKQHATEEPTVLSVNAIPFPHPTGYPCVRLEIETEDTAKKSSFVTQYLIDLGNSNFVLLMVGISPPRNHPYTMLLEQIVKTIEIKDAEHAPPAGRGEAPRP